MTKIDILILVWLFVNVFFILMRKKEKISFSDMLLKLIVVESSLGFIWIQTNDNCKKAILYLIVLEVVFSLILFLVVYFSGKEEELTTKKELKGIYENLRNLENEFAGIVEKIRKINVAIEELYKKISHIEENLFKKKDDWKNENEIYVKRAVSNLETKRDEINSSLPIYSFSQKESFFTEHEENKMGNSQFVEEFKATKTTDGYLTRSEGQSGLFTIKVKIYSSGKKKGYVYFDADYDKYNTTKYKDYYNLKDKNQDKITCIRPATAVEIENGKWKVIEKGVAYY